MNNLRDQQHSHAIASFHGQTHSQFLLDNLQHSLQQRIQTLIRAGYLVLASFLILLFGWSALVPLSTAAISPGVVSVDGYSKQIQHLEGGIITEIAVTDGDHVTAGQTLIKLDDTQVEAEFDKLQSQLILAEARQARLEAEYAGAAQVIFADLMTNTPDFKLQQAINGQRELFQQQRRIIQEKMTNIRERRIRFKQQIQHIKASLSAINKQLSIISNEKRLTEQYVRQGLLTRNDLFTLQSREANILSEIRDKQAELHAVQQDLGVLDSEQEAIRNNRLKEVNQRLQEDRQLMIELQHAISKEQDRLLRTALRAPVNGTVVNLQQHTIGGVIAPGQIIMDIVPEGQSLIIDAKVDPKDRDIVEAGQPAKISFTAFSQRSSRPVDGKVKLISADRITDQVTQTDYFLAKIEITESPESLFKEIPIHPGMQAEVMIVTGERTALNYLITPLQRSFSRAFVEH
ncbi:MAG: HlyD family type I secretion periplasmic adaptor subunit [Gammaproteobacteria bacterium]|nr:HlyD family type I secretion periplasmic adaptor subunit [Gammaproteobacteria bacterium]